jgi:5-methylcytosine-specific restriction protein B
VPQNVYLIGTMNTADRSISLLDAALRRRFGFVELMPDADILKGHMVGSIPLSPWLKALNRKICEHIPRDARNLQIGHSYLFQDGQPLKDFAGFKRALRDDIFPLLEEYCYGTFDIFEEILGKGLIDKTSQSIRKDLFEGGRDVELADALRALLDQEMSEVLSAETQAEEQSAKDEDDEEAVDQGQAP